MNGAAPPLRGRFAPPRRIGELLHLAWPAMLSYLLNSAYRINDQFWIKGLGEKAQAAIGATFFIHLMSFALMYLAMGGTLALVARARGANDPERRDSVARHALFFGLLIGAVLMAVVLPFVDGIVSLLGVEGEAANLAADYLGTLYLFIIPLAIFPVADSIFIGRGNTRIPMLLQVAAVAINYALNPILIYGGRAAEMVDAPGAALFGRIADTLGIEGHGIAGAAYATGAARAITLCGAILILRFGFGTSLLGSLRPKWHRIAAIARISAPSSFSTAIYAGVYWLLLSLVISELGDEALAGLGIGFQVFEGLSFPCYLGISIAGASLVGHSVGAQDRAGAMEAMRSARFVGRLFGLGWAALFYFGGGLLAGHFQSDEGVYRETLRYVHILAFSQYWVAMEAVNEKVLVGAGRTRPILWISPLGNALRVPLGYFFAIALGFGTAGVWWSINATSCLKALLFWHKVQHGPWLDEALADSRREDRIEEERRRDGAQPRVR